MVLTFKLFFVSFSDYSNCASKTDGRVGLAEFYRADTEETYKIECECSYGVPFLKGKVFTVGCSGSDIVSTSVGDLDRLRDQSDVKTVC